MALTVSLRDVAISSIRTGAQSRRSGQLDCYVMQQPFEAGWAVDGRLSSQVQLSARQLPPPSVPEDPAQAARSVQPAQRSSQTPQGLDQDI